MKAIRYISIQSSLSCHGNSYIYMYSNLLLYVADRQGEMLRDAAMREPVSVRNIAKISQDRIKKNREVLREHYFTFSKLLHYF